MKLGRLAFVLLLAFVFAFIGCASSGGDDDSRDDDDVDDDISDDDTADDDCADQSNLGYDEGYTMADFTLYDENGDPLSLYDLCYNVVLIVSAAGWCPVCGQEASSIVEDIYNQYQDKPFRIFYTLFEDNAGNTPSEAYLNAYKTMYKLPFHVYADRNGVLFEYQDTYPTLYVPFNIVLDKNMVIRYEQAGYFPNSIRHYIDMYLEE